MQDLILTQQDNLTMSSREIAELLNKNHSDIKRSAMRLQVNNLLTQPLAEFEFTHKGNVYNEYKLNKRDSVLLVAQNSPEFTAVIIDRWQELESKQPFQTPQTLGDALQLAADQAKQLEVQAPKVQYFDKVLDTTNGFTTTEIATELNMSAIKLNRALKDMCIQRKIGGRWVLTAGNLGNGYTTERTHVDEGGKSRHAMLWTEKGRKFIFDLFKEVK